jgi:hypothetical protein
MRICVDSQTRFRIAKADPYQNFDITYCCQQRSYIYKKDAPDTHLAEYPAIPKAGYPVGAEHRKSGRILNTKFKYLLKYDTKFHASFLLKTLTEAN